MIDSVSLSGTSFTHIDNILKIELNKTYNPGDTVNVKVYYHHLNVNDNAFYVQGGFVFTDAEPEGARKWIPCVDHPSDKATFDLTAKVPSTVKLGSNGRLADSTLSADTIYYHWISRDPVATYLMVITGKVNYNLDIIYWHNSSLQNDSIPIRFYWNEGESIANLKHVETIIIPMISQYSDLFGIYPFEKTGFATLNNLYDSSWAIITPSVGVLFNYFITYEKGSCVLHMLRYILGDSLFFKVLKSYATDNEFKYKNASTAQFINKINDVTGKDYSWFFNQWIYNPNYPVYENTYEITDNNPVWTLNYNITQTQTNTVFFRMPVGLQIVFLNGSDSRISVMNDMNNQQYSFNFNKKPASVIFDPDDNIVLKTASTSLVSVDPNKKLPLEFSLEQNYPNPFNPSTTIKYSIPKASFVTLKVYDILGREMTSLINEEKPAGIYEVKLNAVNLASGVYFYRITAGNFVSTKKFIILK